MLHEFVCITIPKKVIEINDGNIVVETHSGDRQELKTLIKSLQVGDFVVSQQNIILEKVDPSEAEYLFKLIQNSDKEI